MSKNEIMERVEEINDLIKKAEIESAKSSGVIENIKKEWKEKYDTDDIEKIKEKADELKKDYDSNKEHLDSLYKKLNDSYDWEQLEEDLD